MPELDLFTRIRIKLFNDWVALGAIMFGMIVVKKETKKKQRKT